MCSGFFGFIQSHIHTGLFLRSPFSSCVVFFFRPQLSSAKPGDDCTFSPVQLVDVVLSGVCTLRFSMVCLTVLNLFIRRVLDSP